MNKLTLEAVLGFGNLILASANVITSFSVLVYVASHNLRSSVARAFCILSAMIALIYLVDVSLAEVQTVVSANLWLRLQWLASPLFLPLICIFGIFAAYYRRYIALAQGYNLGLLWVKPDNGLGGCLRH